MARLLLTTLALTVTLAAFAQNSNAVRIPISILNPGFEDDVLSCVAGYYCDYQGATGWLAGPGTAVFKPSAAEYPNGIPGGINVVAIGYSGVTGSILQVLPSVLRANATYTLKLHIGARANYAFTGYDAALMAGNTVLASDSSLTPAPGTFSTDLISYNSGPNPPQIGLPIQILVKSIGTGQVDVDDISLSVQ